MAGTDGFETTLNDDLDILWALVGAFLVFFMQCGFAMLESGSVRRENTINILLKNMLDSCVAALVWWAVGYAFALGRGDDNKLHSFIGASRFFSAGIEMSELPKFYSIWLFHWAFAATSATIVSGAVAERCRYQAYVVYTVVITGFVYPVVVHWVWSADGWLSAFNPDRTFEGSLGFLDFAGSSVVHVTGGGAAFFAAWFLGPRVGRFENGKVIDVPKSDQSLIMLGTFILWFGWYAFNSASGLHVRGGMMTAALAAVNTTMAASSGALTVLSVHLLQGEPIQIAPGLNGLLAGLVGITAGCAVVEPFAAVLIGCISGIAYDLWSRFLLYLKIDDPLEASAVHFAAGVVGTVAVGFFATETNVARAYADTFVPGNTDYGVFYGGDGRQLFVQLLGTCLISLWTGTVNSILFGTLTYFEKFRIPATEELGTLNASRPGHQSQPTATEVEMNMYSGAAAGGEVMDSGAGTYDLTNKTQDLEGT